MKLSVKDLQNLIIQVFEKKGLAPSDAKIMAEDLIDADLKGKPHHGVVLVFSYLKQIGEKKHDPLIEQDRGAFFIINGGDTLGPIVANFACEKVIPRAKKYGIATVGVHNRSPFSMAGTYAEKIALNGLVGICMCNSRARVAPFGGYEPVLGPNPISFAFPAQDNPIVMDFATSAITMGDVRLAKSEGVLLPADVAYDSKGNLTRNPDEAVDGSVRVFDGHKGFCLALAIEVLAGPLVLGKAGKSVPGTRGYLFIAMDPGVTGNHVKFLEQIQTFIHEVKSSKPLPGVTQILLPGEQSRMNRKKAILDGITINDDVYNMLLKLVE